MPSASGFALPPPARRAAAHMLLSGAPSRASVPASPPHSPPARLGPPPAPSTGQQCTAGMARWIKEHLGFKSSAKAAPPAPPRPDYRHGGQPPPGGLRDPVGTATPAPQPDIVSAYKLQKERDFEDPYSSSGGRTDPPGAAPGVPPDGRFLSPKHRLIKVEAEKVVPPVSSGDPSPGPGAANSKTPVSPPPEPVKQEKVVILEDYADPFDAKQTSGGQAAPEKVTENDGYMEPYEAQKMMAEIRRRGSKDAVKPLHLYDTPYEPTENGVDSDSEKSAGLKPRESRLPEDDERPPEEYDQPWEWKKDRISKAFAVEIKVIKDLPWPPPVGQLDGGTSDPDGDVTGSHAPHFHRQHSTPHLQSQHSLEDSTVQFEGADKNRMSPSKEEKVRPSHRHSSGNLKPAKHPSLEHTGSIGERIDPTLPLENQFWYHGAISRTDAENLLRLCREASYLVRNSETCKNDFSLSLKSNQGFMHMKLSRTKESKYILGQNSLPFDSVPEIIHHYASRKLPIKGAEHMSLLYPVAIRTL